MESEIGGQFGMEGQRNQFALPGGHASAVGQPGQHLHAVAGALNEGCSNEDGMKGRLANGWYVEVSLEAIHLPKALRFTSMSIAPRVCWSMPEACLASMTMPAQVPIMGRPSRASPFSGAARAYSCIKWSMLVLSPPGMISPSSVVTSWGRRMGKACTRSLSKRPMCSAKAPCSARTPILTILPSSGSQELLRGNGLYVQPGHGGAETAGDFGKDLWVAVVRRGFDDGFGR
jgi:hypothetical protein